jgi:hypothetical protein
MIPIRPYLRNAVIGYYKVSGCSVDAAMADSHYLKYIEWMRNQGVKMPIGADAVLSDDKMIEFTDPKLELMFVLRWA